MRWWKVLGITHFSISVSLRRSSWSGQQLFSISSHIHKYIFVRVHVFMYTITQLLLYIILWFLSTFLYQWHIQRILDINSFIHIIFHKNLIAIYWCVKDSNHTINKIKSCNCFLAAHVYTYVCLFHYPLHDTVCKTWWVMCFLQSCWQEVWIQELFFS